MHHVELSKFLLMANMLILNVVYFYVQVILFESAQIIGLCLFTYMVLPKLPSIIHGLVLMTGVAFIPSFFKVCLIFFKKKVKHTCG